MRNNIKKKQKAIGREKLIDHTYWFAETIKNIVGATMTQNGTYVSLLDGITTNDGATVVSRLSQYKFGDDDIQKMYLSKLMEATEKTDELAGDGTSATTVVTAALIAYLKFHKESSVQTLEKFDKAEKRLLELLDANKRNLVNQEDYENLAIVSTKNTRLGRMIGKAIYDAGDNSLISIRKAVNKAEDYIEIQENYILPNTMCGSGLYEYLEDSNIVIIDSILTDQDNALRQLDHWARANKKPLTIIAKDVDETSVNFVKASNQENADKGAVTLLTMPNMNKHLSQRDIMEDLAAYCNTEVITKEGFNIDAAKADSIKMGMATVNMDREQGTIFTITERGELLEKRIEKLQKELDGYNKDTQVKEIAITKMRINELNGSSVVIYVYARNESALETKVMQIQDAVKATQYSIGYGYIGGAGYFYRKAKNEFENDEVIKLITDRYMDNLRRAMGSKPNKERDERIEKKHTETEMLIVDHDGYTMYADVYERGIIDSARVIENVIKNSFSIGREYARMGCKIVEVDDVEDKTE